MNNDKGEVMKTLAVKAFKYIAAVLGVLASVYGVGWTGALAVHSMFKSQTAEAEQRIEQKINEREAKIMGIHNADMAGLHGKIDVLSRQNETIISQNYKMIRLIKDTP